MVIGSFGPWIKGPFGVSVSGTDGSNDGWIIIILAVVVLYPLLAYRGSKILPMLALLAGVRAARRPRARGDRRTNMTLKGVLALFLIGAAANAAARPMPHASEQVLACRLAGRWQQWTHGVGPSAWSVAPTGAARERGLGNATGTARFLRPRLLRLDWTIPVGVGGVRWSGFYLWRLADCDNGRGWLTFTRGPRASEIHASSLVRTG